MDFNYLWGTVLTECKTATMLGDHGTEHWRRVEDNGLLLAYYSGADETVVRLFALFHDCQRLNDSGWDYNHGPRAAEYVVVKRDEWLSELTDTQFDQLYEACSDHTSITHHDDVTIATCWDADRLDLRRVGIMPDPQFLNTSKAKEIAEKMGSVA